MPRKTLYITPNRRAIWNEAERVAKKQGISLSQFVVRALRSRFAVLDSEEWERLQGGESLDGKDLLEEGVKQEQGSKATCRYPDSQ